MCVGLWEKPAVDVDSLSMPFAQSELSLKTLGVSAVSTSNHPPVSSSSRSQAHQSPRHVPPSQGSE